MAEHLVSSVINLEDQLVTAAIASEDSHLTESSALTVAATTGRARNVQLLLRHLPRLTAERCSDALVVAAGRGSELVVECLLANPRVDAGNRDCAALLAAARSDQAPTLKLLLSSASFVRSRADTSLSAIVERLLDDPLVEGRRVRGVALEWAAAHGQDGLITRLLCDLRLDAAEHGPVALVAAAQHGQMSALRRLLASPRIDPSVCAEPSVCCSHRHSDGDPRVLPGHCEDITPEASVVRSLQGLIATLTARLCPSVYATASHCQQLLLVGTSRLSTTCCAAAV